MKLVELTAPFSNLGLEPHVIGRQAETVESFLRELIENGLAPDRIAAVLRSYVEGRQAGGNPADWIDLVVTGPETVKAARDTGVVVRQLLGEMRERVLVVGFAVNQWRKVFEKLAERLDDNASLSAKLCIEVRRKPTDTAMSTMVVSRFAQNFLEKEWPGKRLPRVFYDPRSLEVKGESAAPCTPNASSSTARRSL